MPNYRRIFLPGGTFFFTVVTHQRRPILIDAGTRKILHEVFLRVQTELPFTIDAICLLPDHMHCIWTLPEVDLDYPTRWKKIKTCFSKAYLRAGGNPGEASESMVKKGEVGIWQRRYWEHTIRDEVDLGHHIDYIHYNPVKHGYVIDVIDWPWSSFHRYMEMGFYPSNWGRDYVDPKIGGLRGGESGR